MGATTTNQGFIIRLVGVLMLSDGWAVQRARNIPGNVAPFSEDPTISLPAIARQPAGSFR